MRFTVGGRFSVLDHLRTERLRPLEEGRAPGLHLGEIIRHMYAESKGWGQGINEDSAVRIQAGFLWETAIEYVLAGIPFDEALRMAFKRYMLSLRVPPAKQLQVEKDGIHMTPDALREQDGTLESYKLSWKSMTKAADAETFANNFEHWLIQEASYCHALGVTKVDYLVYWVNGDYRFGRSPDAGAQVRLYSVEFEPHELVANWERVLEAKKELKIDGR